ncbi:hypothetical protein [Gloeocapsa sp. PCC 73106]|uniref:hypothetical protein n=1 Tax=Gloeocapsa sp. PCC 73106 TaxID=102232 RepID=UPI001181B1C6|nr:hypothetical protein [Gloeocapsa sp. PCC 73106]
MPDKHRPDSLPILGFMYKVLQSPVFGMEKAEALQWMEQCLCQEHAGLELNRKFNQSMLSEFQRTYSKLEYLWPVNREMRLMEKNGSIERALELNRRTFSEFQQLISQ